MATTRKRPVDLNDLKRRLAWLKHWKEAGPLDQDCLDRAEKALGKAAHSTILRFIELEVKLIDFEKQKQAHLDQA